MKSAQLVLLRFLSLVFLLPGLAGLVISAMVSTHYLETLPRLPDPDALRMVPRNIHGVVVYQTPDENRKLTLMEYSSVGVFVVGLGLGLVYLEQWSSARARAAEEDEMTQDPA